MKQLQTLACGMFVFTVLSVHAQQAKPTSDSAAISASQQAQVTIPRLIRFSGAISGASGASLNGPVQIIFTLYRQESDESPLWTETQSVQVDALGRYSVLLGSMQVEGLPAELFSSAEAHWLGAEIQGQPPQPRVLLVSVPYALKAVDADKLSGRSASDFVLAENLSQQVGQIIDNQSQPQSVSNPTSPKVAGAAANGTALVNNFGPSSFTGTNGTQIVTVQQNGGGRGLVVTAPHNTALFTESITGNALQGQTSGQFTTAVTGISTAVSSSGGSTGVYGQSGNGSGVVGISLATSGFIAGVFADGSSSPNGSGLYGQANQWVGLGGQASATSGGPAFGVWGDTLSTDGAGVAGYADATTGPSISVYGSNSSDSGAAFLGTAFSTTGFTSGVVGQVMSPNGTAGVFDNLAGQGFIVQGFSGSNSTEVFSVDAAGNLFVSGSITAGGASASAATLQDGRTVSLYPMQSPENWFEDFGSGKLVAGRAWVPIESSFAQAANPGLTYHVFLTPNGESKGLYISRKTPAGFEVREQGSGTSTIAFDYRVVAKRRGYESVRMAAVPAARNQAPRALLNKRPVKIVVPAVKHATIAALPAKP